MDIDILIGEPAWRGRGVAPRALRLLLARLLQDPEVTLAGMSTASANHAAICAYEKAGFRRHKSYRHPEFGDCCLMI